MYNIRFEKYVPEPKPAESDRIVAAHYYAAWKKGAAGLHNGFDDLAKVYPDRTPLMGYYDEENPEVTDWEIKWAVEHGINCFIHCWYRKLDNMGKPVTEKDLRCGHGLHEALFNAKYQNYMKFTIMFEASPRWGGTDPEDLVANLFPFWLETYFKRDNYLKIDNKPVVFFYQQQRLSREFFPDPAVQKEAFEKCKELARQAGFDGVIFGVCNTAIDPIVHEDAMARGFDFRFGYNAGYSAPDHNPPEEDIINAQCALLQKRLAIDPMAHIPTASCFSDATPRTTQAWIDQGYHFELGKIWYLSPEGYREVIHRMKQMTDALPDGAWGKKIFMIDNWNEWDEGHFVSPSHKFGFGYLQAIREELTKRNNLPDYRTPQDQGFTGYNTSWVTPDFKDFCAQKLAEKED